MGTLEIRLQSDIANTKISDILDTVVAIWDTSVYKPAGWDTWTNEQKTSWVSDNKQYIYHIGDTWSNLSETPLIPIDIGISTWDIHSITLDNPESWITPENISIWTGIMYNVMNFKIFIDDVEQSTHNLI